MDHLGLYGFADLGSAGVLNGKRATSHWAAVDALEGFEPHRCATNGSSSMAST